MRFVLRLKHAGFAVGSWCIRGATEKNRDEVVGIRVKGSIGLFFCKKKKKTYILYETVEHFQLFMERANLRLAEMRLDCLRLLHICNHSYQVGMVLLRLFRMLLLPIANFRDQGNLVDKISAYSRYRREKREAVPDKSCRECQSCHGNS